VNPKNAIDGENPKVSRRIVWGWALYDWANSAFATAVMSGFFPVFFKEFWSAGSDVNLSTARLGLANSLASLAVALAAPVLGAIADRGSRKKAFLIFFAYFGVLMTALLCLVARGGWLWATVIYALAIVGFSGANIFYDALLPSVSAGRNMDTISSLGFAMGYLGGGLLFLLDVIVVLKPAVFGFADATVAVRFSFLSVAVWWGGFTLFTIVWVPGEKAERRPAGQRHLFTEGFAQFADTLGQVRHLKTLFMFLIGYWCYIDGVDTIIRMAIDYGITIGLKSSDLITALLVVQFVGFPAALVFGRLGSRWGVKRSLFLAIGVYGAVTLSAAMMTRKEEFYILAVVIGLVQGGIQALSRSYFARLIPAGRDAQFFGFYNMFGKFAAILGPLLVGVVSLGVKRMLISPGATADQIQAASSLAARWGIVSVLLLFIAGGVLLFFVDEEKGRREAAAFK
jgi:UMF1 family MFS transporter